MQGSRVFSLSLDASPRVASCEMILTYPIPSEGILPGIPVSKVKAFEHSSRESPGQNPQSANARERNRCHIGRPNVFPVTGSTELVDSVNAQALHTWGGLRLPNLTQLNDQLCVHSIETKELLTEPCLSETKSIAASCCDVSFSSELRSPYADIQGVDSS